MDAFGQYDKTVNCYSPYVNGYYCYNPTTEAFTNTNSGVVGVSYEDPGENEDPIILWHRRAFSFNLAGIPTNATINWSKLHFSTTSHAGIDANCGALTAAQLSNNWTSWGFNQIFNTIIDGTSLCSQSVNSNTQYTFTLSSQNWNTIVNDVIVNSPHKLGMGLFNTGEPSLRGVYISNPYLEVNVHIPTPPQPTNLQVSSIHPGSFVLSWVAPGGTVTEYTVYKNGSVYSTTSQTQMLICGLSPYTTYNLKVLPKNANGDGDMSAEIPGTTNAGMISGNLSLCNLEPYTLDYIPTGGTITWASSSNMSLSSAQNLNPANFQKVTNGNGTITVSVSSTCENYIATSPTIHTGSFSSGDYPITGPSSAPCRTYVYYSIPTLAGATSINWIYPSGMTYVSGQNTTNLALRTGTSTSSGIIQVKVNNICGQGGSYANKYTTVYGSCLMSLNLSPNPANNEVRVSIPESANMNIIADTSLNSITTSNTPEKSSKSSKYRVIILDKNGVLYSDFTQYSNAFTISTQGLKNGNYIVNVTDGINTYTSNLIVMH